MGGAGAGRGGGTSKFEPLRPWPRQQLHLRRRPQGRASPLAIEINALRQFNSLAPAAPARPSRPNNRKNKFSKIIIYNTIAQAFDPVE